MMHSVGSGSVRSTHQNMRLYSNEKEVEDGVFPPLHIKQNVQNQNGFIEMSNSNTSHYDRVSTETSFVEAPVRKSKRKRRRKKRLKHQPRKSDSTVSIDLTTIKSFFRPRRKLTLPLDGSSSSQWTANKRDCSSSVTSGGSGRNLDIAQKIIHQDMVRDERSRKFKIYRVQTLVIVIALVLALIIGVAVTINRHKHHVNPKNENKSNIDNNNKRDNSNSGDELTSNKPIEIPPANAMPLVCSPKEIKKQSSKCRRACDPGYCCFLDENSGGCNVGVNAHTCTMYEPCRGIFMPIIEANKNNSDENYETPKYASPNLESFCELDINSKDCQNACSGGQCCSKTPPEGGCFEDNQDICNSYKSCHGNTQGEINHIGKEKTASSSPFSSSNIDAACYTMTTMSSFGDLPKCYDACKEHLCCFDYLNSFNGASFPCGDNIESYCEEYSACEIIADPGYICGSMNAEAVSQNQDLSLAYKKLCESICSVAECCFNEILDEGESSCAGEEFCRSYNACEILYGQ